MGVLQSIFEKSKKKSNEAVFESKNVRYINFATPLKTNAVQKKENYVDEGSAFEQSMLRMQQKKIYDTESDNDINEDIVYSLRPSQKTDTEIVMLYEWHYFKHNYDVFHFTSDSNARSILEDRYIRPTQARIPCKFNLK